MNVPKWSVPALIVLLTVGGLALARIIAIPSVIVDYPEASNADLEKAGRVTFLIDGVRCVKSAEAASLAFNEAPGVLRFTAFASRNRPLPSVVRSTDASWQTTGTPCG